MEEYRNMILLFNRGDTFFNIRGLGIEEVLKSLIKVLRPNYPLDKEALLSSLVEREELGSTAIGEGFAIPHPRHFFIKDKAQSFLVVAYLDHAVEWNAMDGKSVSTLFLLMSADTKEHLNTLSELASLAENPEFIHFIAKRPSKLALQQFLNPMPTK